jgi:hypothetical protein
MKLAYTHAACAHMASYATFFNQVPFQEGQFNLVLGNRPPGMYLLKITDSKGKTFTNKFIVQ